MFVVQPSLYLRYVDDVFGVLEHGRPSLLDYVCKYISFLNTVHTAIKFTIEDTSDTGELAYLSQNLNIGIGSLSIYQ